MDKQKVIALLMKLQSEITSESVKEKYRTSEKYFIRRRQLTFSNLIMMRLNMLNKTLSVEIEKISNYLTEFTQRIVPSKQAFSKSASHIKWEGFKHFNEFFVKSFYQDTVYRKFANKYILAATDGSDFHLPNVPELKAHFGSYTNGQMPEQCTAKCVKLYDVINHITISSILAPYIQQNSKGVSEKSLFDLQIEKLPELLDLKEVSLLITGDKYYPCFRYLYSLPRKNIDFLFRCREKFCLETAEFARSGQLDAIITIDMNKSRRKYGKDVNRKSIQGTDENYTEAIPDIITVRCVRIERGKGEAMFLLTNIPVEELSREQIGKGYEMRWGEETSFDLDKNTLEIENFSSKTVNGILQEFYAKTLTANITELLVCQAQSELDIEQKQKNNIHPYIINRKVAYGLVKDEIVVFLNDLEHADLWFDRMTKKILRHRSPVRPGRYYPKKRKFKTKFSMNMRRST